MIIKKKSKSKSKYVPFKKVESDFSKEAEYLSVDLNGRILNIPKMEPGIKNPNSEYFNLNKRLSSDSVIKYSIDGIVTYKRIDYIITKDPVFIYNLVYNKPSKIKLQNCAIQRLKIVLKEKHPDLYNSIEQRKLKYRSSLKVNLMQS